MNARVAELRRRRVELVERAAAERERLSFYVQRLEPAADGVERIVAVLNYLRQPVVATSLTALLMSRRVRRAGPVPRMVFGIWQLALSLNRLRS
jgi:hypothetical protein